MRSPNKTLEAAAHALARGAPIDALGLIGQRTEPMALALRGMAMAQMREYESARALLAEAIAGFDEASAPLSRARALAALAEISVAERDLTRAEADLGAAADVLAELGDLSNAVWTRLVQARLAAFCGGFDIAEDVVALAKTTSAEASPTVRAAVHIAEAELHARRFAPSAAQKAYELARQCFGESDNPLLWRELESAEAALTRPAFEVRSGEQTSIISSLELEDVHRQVIASGGVLVDAARRNVELRETSIDLKRRPVLFELVYELARAWPNSAPASQLISSAFELDSVTEALRERLRVELSRLRKVIADVAAVTASEGGWCLEPGPGVDVAVVVPRYHTEFAALQALLSDGELWSAKSLALVLGKSPRTVQRHLGEMVEADLAESIGDGKLRRYGSRLKAAAVGSQMLSLGLLS